LAIGQTIWGLRADAIQEAATNTANISVVLSEQLARSMQSVDIVLTDIRERTEARTASAQEFDQYVGSPDLSEFLRQRLSRLSQADFIAIIDRDGHIATTTQHWVTPKTDAANRDYFQHFTHENNDRIYISNVSTNRVTGARTIFLSKRINSSNGDFLGVVLVGLGVSYFQSIYDSITPLHDQSIAVLHPDGTVLVRYPTAIDRSNQKMPPGSPWYKAVAEGGGHYWSPGFFDGQARLVAVQPLHDYPLVINVAVSEAAALAHWYRRATLIGIGTLLALLCSAFLLKLLSKQLRRLLVSEAALARREVTLAEKTRELQQANGHLDAALQNISQGLCMFDSDGRLVICNDRYLRMYNLSADMIRPGSDLLEMIEHRRQRGTFTGDPAEYELKLRSAARNKERINLTVELEDELNRLGCDVGLDVCQSE
jgi:PAS domain-containing protein